MGRRRKKRKPPQAPASPPPLVGPERSRRRLYAAGAAAVLLLVAVLVGWRARSSRGVRRESGLNVLLVTIDTLRADALGVHGGPDEASPWIDRLARAGVRFEQARGHNVTTLPSHANILSGRYPFEHGVRDNTGFRFPREVETLATLLQANGYRTGAFLSGFPLHSRFGLDHGFEVYDDSFAEEHAPQAFVLPERPAVDTVTTALRWLDAGDRRPHLLWVHLYDPHAPYRPPEPHAARFPGNPYLGEVAATDEALRPLLEPLLAAGSDGRTLVVLTSDHGESLGEHGEATHGLFAYEATLRVPLVLFAPRLLPPRVVTTPARHVDLLPTILDALRLPVPEHLSGRSLLPLAAGGFSTEPVTTYFEALSGQLTRGWAPLYGVVEGGRKYVELPIPELYELREDSAEASNLAQKRHDEVAALSRSLRRFRARDPGATTVREDVETLQRLAALGYVASATTPPAKSEYTAADDPKRLVELDGLLERVISLHRDGRPALALELCQELVARRPGMAVSHAQLAMLHARLGHIDEAVEAAGKAVALNPADVMPAVLLAGYLTGAGRPGEAADLLEPHAERRDPDFQALTARGTALAQLGRRQDALASFARAREIDPGDAAPLVKMAMVHTAAGAYDAAREALEQAVALDPRLAVAHHHLGLLAVQRGEEREAEGHFRRALALDPNEVDVLLNLGLLLAREGRRDEARPLLERFVRLAPRPLFGGAVQRVQRWLARGPGDPPAPSP